MFAEFVTTSLKLNDILFPELEKQEGLWVCVLMLQTAGTIESA